MRRMLAGWLAGCTRSPRLRDIRAIQHVVNPLENLKPDPGTGEMEESEIRAEVRRIILELAPEPPDNPPADVELTDLGYHSLALLELAFELEDTFDLTPIEQEEAMTIRTTGHVQDLVIEQLRTRDMTTQP
jgi:acyl carrier protein